MKGQVAAGRARDRRGYLHAALAGLLLVEVLLVVHLSWDNWPAPYSTGDWRIYLSALGMLRSGQGALIYDYPTLAAVQRSLGFDTILPFNYHPVFLLLAYPFALLPLGLSYPAWQLFNLALLVACLGLLARGFLPRGEALTYALVAAAGLPVMLALRLGQASLVLLLGLTLFAWGCQTRRQAAAGLGLGVLLIKPQLLPLLLLYVAWRWQWAALAWFAVVAATIGALSSALVGLGGLHNYAALLLGGNIGFWYPWSHTLMGLAQSGLGPDYAWPGYILLCLVQPQNRSSVMPVVHRCADHRP